MAYPVTKYTPYTIPFKRIRLSAIVWPMQPRELVFTTLSIVARISAFSSPRPVQHAVATLTCVCKPAASAKQSLSDVLGLCMPAPAVTCFLVQDSRGVSPWMELLKRTGVLVQPRPCADTFAAVGVRRDTWLVAQTEENHRVLVRVLNKAVTHVLSLRGGCANKFAGFQGTRCVVRESVSVKSGKKRVFLVIEADGKKLAWSIVAFGLPVPFPSV